MTTPQIKQIMVKSLIDDSKKITLPQTMQEIELTKDVHALINHFAYHVGRELKASAIPKQPTRNIQPTK